jgi:hypothetical protein
MNRLRIARLCRLYGLSEAEARLLASFIFGEARND